MINTLEKLGAYTVWANAKLLAHLDGLVAAGQQLPERTLRLFSHALNAQAIWLARLTDTQSPVKVWQEHDLAGLHKLHLQTSPSLHNYTQQADDQELHRLISYTNSQNQAYTSQVSDILTHACVHGNYHRAQVATDLRANGLEPINTDFITYCRELSATAASVPSL
ncbi:damage-inducible protein DinB [Hymenobacter busanensis]|uniref:Damage-inducible protein DinB n=1 Tax=Hymenobacter busanensis TaxID=2607656 RepID=A0A7L5A1Q4_9BACT|nr:DinB family protein [Hymenobacter busanensis]KAA9332974.1 damage-inducible protein DinB [Hymenobacter busanensis]QHJ08352.1 damage-inducible protein DinB [Hymenobacter busanensis]